MKVEQTPDEQLTRLACDYLFNEPLTLEQLFEQMKQEELLAGKTVEQLDALLQEEADVYCNVVKEEDGRWRVKGYDEVVGLHSEVRHYVRLIRQRPDGYNWVNDRPSGVSAAVAHCSAGGHLYLTKVEHAQSFSSEGEARAFCKKVEGFMYEKVKLTLERAEPDSLESDQG